jgi:hypothetical protein
LAGASTQQQMLRILSSLKYRPTSPMRRPPPCWPVCTCWMNTSAIWFCSQATSLSGLFCSGAADAMVQQRSKTLSHTWTCEPVPLHRHGCDTCGRPHRIKPSRALSAAPPPVDLGHVFQVTAAAPRLHHHLRCDTARRHGCVLRLVWVVQAAQRNGRCVRNCPGCCRPHFQLRRQRADRARSVMLLDPMRGPLNLYRFSLRIQLECICAKSQPCAAHATQMLTYLAITIGQTRYFPCGSQRGACQPPLLRRRCAVPCTLQLVRAIFFL